MFDTEVHSEISLRRNVHLNFVLRNLRCVIFPISGSVVGSIILIKPILGLLSILLLFAFFISVLNPVALIAGYFLYAPFTEYVRHLLPVEIMIGNNAFILAGAAKEIFLLLVIFSFLYRRCVLRIEYRGNNTTLHLMIIFLSWLFICILRSGNLINGLWGAREYFYCFAFFFIGYYILDDKQSIMQIIWAFLFSSAILVIVGLVQIIYDPNFIVSPEKLIGKAQESYVHYRTTSLLSNPNSLGTFLVEAILFSCVLLSYSVSKISRFWLIPLSVLSTIVVFYTLSRESWLAFVIGFIILGIIQLKNKKFFRVILFMMCLVTILALMPPHIYERIKTINISGGITRIIMWKDILTAISKDLVFGLGPGSIGGFGLETIELKGTTYAVADNSYIRVLVDSGVVGLSLFLVIIFAVGKVILSSFALPGGKVSKKISLCALLAYSTLLTTSFFSSSLFSWLVSYIFWLLVGFISSHNSNHQLKNFSLSGNR